MHVWYHVNAPYIDAYRINVEETAQSTISYIYAINRNEQ